jgi:hypothetical protein
MGNRRPGKGEKVQWNSHGSTTTENRRSDYLRHRGGSHGIPSHLRLRFVFPTTVRHLCTRRSVRPAPPAAVALVHATH